MMNEIICYKLKEKDITALKEDIKRFSSFKVLRFNSIEEISNHEDAAIFIYIDEAMSLLELENIFSQRDPHLIHVILKNKNFDVLMLCYKYKIAAIFEDELQKKEISKVITNLDLYLSSDQAPIPVQTIAELFSYTLKIKNDQQCYERLTSYFKQFEHVKFFDLLSIEASKREFVSGAEVSKNISKIKLPKIDRNYIGMESLLKLDGEEFIFTPIYHNENRSLWLMAQIDRKHRRFILNKLFYKFLENINIYRQNKEKELNLEVLATTDDVTGLFNQRKLTQDLADTVKYHEKFKKTFSIMFIDVDHFKSVNDNYGHVIGSKLLTDIGEVLSKVLRASDDIYRYGGDEFVVIMPSVDIKTVHEIATRILNKIKSKKFDIGDGEDYQLSVSIGIAEYPTDATSAVEIVQFADEMMYQSKKSGRGKVFHIKEV